MSERWCFEQDDDCHWYLIPLKKKRLFNALMNIENDEEFIDAFEDYHIDYNAFNISFENPEEIK